MKLCLFCKNLEWDEGHPCPTCGYDAKCECIKGHYRYGNDVDDQRNWQFDAMTCEDFEWHPDILKNHPEVKE